MPDNERVIIIGAGVAGLTAGIALNRGGIHATVFEASSELREIGAGLGVQYAAIKALRRIGLEEGVREIGAPLRVSKRIVKQLLKARGGNAPALPFVNTQES